MVLTIAMYSGFTFFSALSQEWWHLAIFRFLVAIGVGGDHQFTGFAQQPLHRLVLARRLGLDQHLPALGHDRQISEHLLQGFHTIHCMVTGNPQILR